MRREALYLQDIVEAADAITRFLTDVQREDFMHDEMRQSAVLQKITIIGEAASRLPQTFRVQHADIEWGDIIGFRNIAVHAYFSISWPIVWVTATQDVPALRSTIAEILATDYIES